MTGESIRGVAEVRRLLSELSGRRLGALIDELSGDSRPGVVAAVAAARRRREREDAEQRRLASLYRLERRLAAEYGGLVAGVDEVGRGALAGPLTAGACILPQSPRIAGLDDSKRLTPAARREVAEQIREVAVCWSVAHVDPQTIDAAGVTAALRRAMIQALEGLVMPCVHIVVDGRPMGLDAAETAVVGGDGKVAAIAAASVIAKVERDELMVRLAAVHPEYGFDVNKGYGTAEHLDAIARHGRSPVHRVSFCPGKGSETLF